MSKLTNWISGEKLPGKVKSVFSGLGHESILFLLIILLVIIFSSLTPTFMSYYNIRSSLLAMVTTGLVAIGQTLVLITGGFDLSVGSIFVFSGISAGMLLNMGVPVIIAIFLALIIGGFIGLFNGLIIAKIGVNPFIVTLATMTAIRGAVLAITTGQVIGGLPKSFNFIGQGDLLGLPFAVWVLLFLILLGEILLRKHYLLRKIFYVGSNERAAEVSPINVDRVKISVFVASGVFSALAGIISTARMGSIMATAGSGVNLDSIAAAVIGGVALGGGTGSILGAFLGVGLLTIIMNFLLLIGVSPYWQNLFSGLILLVVVIISVLTQRKTVTA